MPTQIVISNNSPLVGLLGINLLSLLRDLYTEVWIPQFALEKRKMTKEHKQACADTYYQRGLAHAKKGEIELAIEDYTHAIALNPEFAEAYYQRGLAYAKKGELDKAITDYTKAIALKPDYADAYYNRGGAFLRLGEQEKAESDLTIARNMGSDAITALDEILRNYDRAWKTLGNL